MWPFAKKHPFTLSRITKLGRAHRKGVIHEINRWSLLLPNKAHYNDFLEMSVKVGGEYHLLRLENFVQPPRESNYDWHADLTKNDFMKSGWYLVGRVKFNLLDDKITRLDVTHLAAKKVIQGSNEGP